MIRKAKDYIAWGNINPETLALILKNRGKLEGRKDLTEEYLIKTQNSSRSMSWQKQYAKVKLRLMMSRN